jgi:hypothetical protein
LFRRHFGDITLNEFGRIIRFERMLACYIDVYAGDDPFLDQALCQATSTAEQDDASQFTNFQPP